MQNFYFSHNTKTPFGTGQFEKIGVLVNFIIQELIGFSQTAQLFCVSVSLVRVKYEGTRQNKKHIFRAYDTAKTS